MADWIAQTAALLRFDPWRSLWLRWVRFCILYLVIYAAIALRFGSSGAVYGVMLLTLILQAGHLRRYLPPGVQERMYQGAGLGFLLAVVAWVVGLAGMLAASVLAWDPFAVLEYGAPVSESAGPDWMPIVILTSGAIGIGLGQGRALRRDIPAMPVAEWVIGNLASIGLAGAIYSWSQTAFAANGLAAVLAALGAGALLGALPGLMMVRLVGLYLPRTQPAGGPPPQAALTTSRN
jgi:hypothetical protein